MANANVLNLEGTSSKSMELPKVFSERVRPDLIMRAVLAENSQMLQPQAHYVLAGMQTTARYYGAMNSWRTGRHMGIAIRPREKLGGGIQGKVKRIPSAVKGKRAHPHLVEKTIAESINKKEYQKAIMSAIAATSSEHLNKAQTHHHLPIIVSNDIESLKKTSEVIKLLERLKLEWFIEHGKKKTIRKGIRRLSKQKLYKKSILIIVNEDKGIIKAAQNIPGLDACTLKNVKANLLAPGGRPGRLTVWAESALGKIDEEIKSIDLKG
jgi:large subunit ribosomal protein L4e